MIVDAPIDSNAKALLELVYRVSIHVRAYSSGEGRITPSQLHWLMDAIHNIPLYLQSGHEDYWSGIEWSMRHYDQRFADQPPQIRLVEVLSRQAGGSPPRLNIIQRPNY
jgi:hypothetical protein